MSFITRRLKNNANPSTPINTTTDTHDHLRNDGFGNTTKVSAGEPKENTPSFGQWIKMSWLDLITMLCMGMIGLGIYFARPAPTRSFPVYFQDGEIVYPQFAYPLRRNIIPIWAAALMASLIPIAIILLMQLRDHSFWNANNAIIGLLYSLITAAVFQVFLKWLIGGLRPHFLTVCKPRVPVITVEETGRGLRNIMYDRRICTGNENEINDSLESFPSGHSTAAFAGFVFLFLYLNSKLKVWSNYHPAMWKMIVLWAPILGATLIAASLTIDEYHNWYDCVAGAMIGSLMAFSAYRMVFASIWDFKTNHIPLSREVQFLENESKPKLTSTTRRVGWGEKDYGTNVNLENYGSSNADNFGHSNLSRPYRIPITTTSSGVPYERGMPTINYDTIEDILP